MSQDAFRLRKTAIEHVLHGPGHATGDARRAAYDLQDLPESTRGLLEKVARNAWKVTDDDVEAAKRAGVTEDEIFELVVAAALGQANRQLETALAALDAAEKEGAA